MRFRAVPELAGKSIADSLDVRVDLIGNL